MFAETVEVQQIGKIMVIGINRPERRNAVDPNTASQLSEAFTKFESDPNSQVAVLYGKGYIITLSMYGFHLPKCIA